MSERELRDLGVWLTERVQNQNSDALITINTNEIGTMATATTEIQANSLHAVIDSSSSEGKKLHQKATQSFPADQKCDGNPKDTIKLFEHVQSKSEKFGWSSIASNIGPDYASIF